MPLDGPIWQDINREMTGEKLSTKDEREKGKKIKIGGRTQATVRTISYISTATRRGRTKVTSRRAFVVLYQAPSLQIYSVYLLFYW
jgi:hypothetical protein